MRSHDARSGEPDYGKSCRLPLPAPARTLADALCGRGTRCSSSSFSSRTSASALRRPRVEHRMVRMRVHNSVGWKGLKGIRRPPLPTLSEGPPYASGRSGGSPARSRSPVETSARDTGSTVAAGHHDVGENQVRRPSPHKFQALLAIAPDPCFANALQERCDIVRQLDIVLHDQHFRLQLAGTDRWRFRFTAAEAIRRSQGLSEAAPLWPARNPPGEPGKLPEGRSLTRRAGHRDDSSEQAGALLDQG